PGSLAKIVTETGGIAASFLVTRKAALSGLPDWSATEIGLSQRRRNPSTPDARKDALPPPKRSLIYPRMARHKRNIVSSVSQNRTFHASDESRMTPRPHTRGITNKGPQFMHARHFS